MSCTLVYEKVSACSTTHRFGSIDMHYVHRLVVVFFSFALCIHALAKLMKQTHDTAIKKQQRPARDPFFSCATAALEILINNIDNLHFSSIISRCVCVFLLSSLLSYVMVTDSIYRTRKWGLTSWIHRETEKGGKLYFIHTSGLQYIQIVNIYDPCLAFFFLHFKCTCWSVPVWALVFLVTSNGL